jgi:DNA-directed RNA polymerase specialized sigma24 family protein
VRAVKLAITGGRDHIPGEAETKAPVSASIDLGGFADWLRAAYSDSTVKMYMVVARQYLAFCDAINADPAYGFEAWASQLSGSIGTQRVRAGGSRALASWLRGAPEARPSKVPAAPLSADIVEALASLRHRQEWFIRSRGLEEDADDILQEIALDLVRRPPPAGVHPSAAVFCRTRSIVVQWLRRERGRPLQLRPDLARRFSTTNEGPARTFLRETLSAVKQLRDREREVVLLSAIGATPEEAARALHLPKSSVSHSLKAARRRLARWTSTGVVVYEGRPLATLGDLEWK